MSLRWRLATWLVGPVIRQPDEGATVVVVENGYVASFKLTTFRFRMTNRISPLEPWPFEDGEKSFRNTPIRRIGKFVGTVH